MAPWRLGGKTSQNIVENVFGFCERGTKLLRPLPEGLVRHLVLRTREREITAHQLMKVSAWVASEPEVPAGRWFKRFPGLIVCGEGELVKTFLRTGQVPDGEEVF
ncbi:MAG TPA: hypothetical protein VGO11_02845 [Chthoniobacteraceae bacterium]|nr:hypothetical protein [Chthoniobacteraceae bacterium]